MLNPWTLPNEWTCAMPSRLYLPIYDALTEFRWRAWNVETETWEDSPWGGVDYDGELSDEYTMVESRSLLNPKDVRCEFRTYTWPENFNTGPMRRVFLLPTGQLVYADGTFEDTVPDTAIAFMPAHLFFKTFRFTLK
jgi:hypothetical protein